VIKRAFGWILDSAGDSQVRIAGRWPSTTRRNYICATLEWAYSASPARPDWILTEVEELAVDYAPLPLPLPSILCELEDEDH